jgi:hypothetical protein
MPRSEMPIIEARCPDLPNRFYSRNASLTRMPVCG